MDNKYHEAHQSVKAGSMELRARTYLGAHRTTHFYLTALCLILVASLLVILSNPLRANADAAMYLQLGQRIIDGQQPYLDFAEINLPTIYYISAIPALVARLLSVNAIPVLMIGTWLFTVFIVGLCLFLMRHPRQSTRQFVDLRWVIVLVLAIQSLVLLWPTPSDPIVFAEREHLFVLLFMPWVLLRWLRSSGQRLPIGVAILIGFAAALGVSLKPHFLIMVLALEIFWLLAVRNLTWQVRQPEVMGALAFCVLYGTYWAMNPESVQSYFVNTLPMLSTAYDAYAQVPTVLLGLQQAGVLLLCAIAVFTLRRHPPNIRRLAGSFVVLSIAAIVSYAVQEKGWYYQTIPILFFSAMTLALAIYPLVAPLARLGLTLGITAMLLIGTAAHPYESIRDPALYELVESRSNPDDTIMIVETGVSYVYPLLEQVQRRQASRYVVAYPLAFAYYGANGAAIHDSAQRLPPLAEQYLAELAEDIERNIPALILIGTRRPCTACPPDFQLAEYLRARGIIRDAIEPAYDYLGAVAHFDVYSRQR